MILPINQKETYIQNSIIGVMKYKDCCYSSYGEKHLAIVL